eukprot:TRINITY_DN12010_c0_g1_i15.p1 TRINITY_DN12010_c0_g1~~TRINITY_DN12010_c0_g1_i15.p1  ORF type:complete len:245 (-),score=23.42 TRINITY_DN12010_c0_g1_i15:357-1091(-)
MYTSNKVSAASYSIGTEKRKAPDKSTISPGPVYVPKPTSKWLGDAPKFSMSTSQRASMSARGKGPGPDVYRMNSSVGYQVESHKNSSPNIMIGTEGRQQHTGKRNPIYTDTLFPSVTSLGHQLCSGQRTFPHAKIGTDSRFREFRGDQGPGPGQYKNKAAIGRQVESQNRSFSGKSFGVRHSAKASAGGLGTVSSPGPQYRLRDGFSRQVTSKNRSAASHSIGQASRFKSRPSDPTPGPAHYHV